MANYYLRIFKPITKTSSKNKIDNYWIEAPTLVEATDICISEMRPQDMAYIYDSVQHAQLVYIGKGYKTFRMNDEN